MNDDLKKTVLQPKFANLMSYHTLVMDQPPEMTAVLSKEEVKQAKATSIGALRTRMLDANAMPTFHNQGRPPSTVGPVSPGLVPLPLPPPSTMQVQATKSSKGPRRLVRRAIAYGGVAITLGVSLVLPVSGDSKRSEAASVPSAEQPEDRSALSPVMPPTDAPRESPATAQRPEVSPAQPTSATEEQAGAMLLAGRRVEALALYRELAMSPSTTPGIEAMVEVISQKIATQ
ncbi:MAG: hypothetical protein GY811_15965 [Myxococcales bacterium]|nr:hypothetical protein [Myxococcales bacterium]